MNFDTHRKNYTGLAFVAVLHLVAAGIALKNSTVWISHPEPGFVSVLPAKPTPPDPQPQASNDFDIPRTNPVTTRLPDELDIKWETEKTITTTTPDGTQGEREPGGRATGGGNGNGSVEPAHHEPAVVAAVIDAASCARPAYPAAALRNGDEGTVTLAFLVGKDGRVASARVERSSGHRDLDRAALQGLSLCAFKPGTIDGVAQESWARMQYAWHLDE